MSQGSHLRTSGRITDLQEEEKMSVPIFAPLMCFCSLGFHVKTMCVGPYVHQDHAGNPKKYYLKGPGKTHLG